MQLNNRFPALTLCCLSQVSTGTERGQDQCGGHVEHVCPRHEICHGRWVLLCRWDNDMYFNMYSMGASNRETVCVENLLKWDFPYSLFYFILLFNIQSTRSTACVRVQTIWTSTSRWSGSIMNTARSCPLSKSMYQNIQRKCILI